jgi:hypothetical protein
MMRDYRRDYDDNLCLYYEKEKVYYDNRYPEHLKDALRDLECKEIDIGLVNGDTLEDVILDEVERDYIAVRKKDCDSICLLPLDKINWVCIPDELANDLWGKKIKKYCHK